jgi:pimeloyl-ACP methyl ester carboxylesterase
LIAPSPLESVVGVSVRLAARYPMAFACALATGDLTRALPAFESFFFSPALEPALRATYRSKLSSESIAAVLDTFGRTPHDPSRVRTPVLVVAAEDDTSIPVAVNQRLAARYGTACLVVPGAHSVMLDAHWQDAARALQSALMERLAVSAARECSRR